MNQTIMTESAPSGYVIAKCERRTIVRQRNQTEVERTANNFSCRIESRLGVDELSHARAFASLALEMEWMGVWAMGKIPGGDGYVFVCLSHGRGQTFEKADATFAVRGGCVTHVQSGHRVLGE